MFLVETAATLTALVVFLVAGWSSWLADLARGATNCVWTQVAIYGAVFITIGKLLMFPLNWYAGFRLEHRFGLSTQSALGWLADQIKAWGVSLVLGLIALESLYACLRIAGSWWWLWAGLVFFVFGVLLSALFPVVILPLFFKVEPLDNESLRTKLEAQASRVGVRLIGIYRLALSGKTHKANAAFAGLGRTRRILLGDTLLDHFAEDEIEVVMAHEMAHYRNRDIVRMIAWGAASTFVGFWLCELVYRNGLERLGFDGRADLGALPLLALVLFLFGLVTMPLNNAFSRWRERKADAGALELTGNRDGFIRAMRKLADQNLADISPHPLIEFLLHSHPSIARRIAFAERWRPS
jgi:STE24 endopeptidase